MGTGGWLLLLLVFATIVALLVLYRVGVLAVQKLDDNASRLSWSKALRSRYENWYCIVNHQTEPLAFWFRYTLEAFEEGRREPEGRLWSIFFDKAHPENNFLFTTRVDIERARVRQDPFGVELESLGAFRAGRMTGQHASDGLEVSWDFSFEPSEVSFHTVGSELVAALISSSRNVSPNNDIRYTGKLTINDRVIDFEDAPGHQGHTWGTKMQRMWVWCHCNAFDNDPEAVFEGVSIRKPKGDELGPAMASMYLKYGGRHYFLNTIKHVKKLNSSDFAVDHWTFRGTCEDVRIEGRLEPDPEQTHYVRYLDVDEQELFNRNSCLGRGRIKVFRQVDGDWKLETELVSTHTVAFEYVDRQKDEHEYRPDFDT